MLLIRLAKVAVIAALAAFALMVAYDNVFDYNSNYQFVRHVLSMDTIFPDSVLRSRAIDSETMWRAAYALIIATEASTGLLLALGAGVLLGRSRAPGAAFNHAKLWAIAGLTLGFCLWFFGFVVVGGEYFAMWQSKMWNGQEAAFRIATTMLAALVFVSLPDRDLA
jgi:predicted small integral membrane protein